MVTAAEIAQEIGVSKGKAYEMIRIWNEALREKGYSTVPGKVSRKYFYDQFYGMAEMLTTKEDGHAGL